MQRWRQPAHTPRSPDLTAVNVVAFVFVLVLGLALVNAIVWVPILLWLKKKRVAAHAALDAELAASGETIVRGPEPGLYRGGTGGYSGVSGNATLLLTDRRLVVVKVTGGRVDVPRDRMTGVRLAKAFRGSVKAGRVHVVVSAADGAEVGFLVGDPDAWVAALS